MRVVHGYRAATAADRGAHAAVGNFDGVHRGHQTIIEEARARAAEAGGPLAVVTFEPHPRRYFAPDAPPFQLTPPPLLARRLAKLGVDLLYVLDFDRSLATLPAEEFATDVLGEALGLRSVVVGADFRFGKGRGGDADLLRSLGALSGYGVAIRPIAGEAGGRFSSSAIRAALAAGDPRDAARQLGYWHRIDGVVKKGAGRGRGLGMPTANMALGDVCRPAFGVYAVEAELLDDPGIGVRPGIASIGVNPTFDDRDARLEVHLFDFDGDLYGARLSTALRAFQRPEAKFDSVTALVEQMRRDAQEARAILADPTLPWDA